MVAIIDYGVGNLFSLKSSFSAIGADAVVTSSKSELEMAESIILPGVGAFCDAAKKLKDSGLEDTVISLAKAGKPLMGICLGMQTAVIEYARHVLGYEDANSGEFAPDGKHNVIDLMPEQLGVEDMGGTMRLGAYPCVIKKDSMMAKAYGKEEVSERHRHRYEFNNDYREEIEKAGMKITGTSPNGLLVEAVEIPENRFFVGVQYHPEFKSRPNRAHPLFREFIKASLEK